MLEGIALDPIDQRRISVLVFLAIWLSKGIYLFSSLSGISDQNYTPLFITLDIIYFTFIYYAKIPIWYTSNQFKPLNVKITGLIIVVYGILVNLGMDFTSFSKSTPANTSSRLPTTAYNPRGQLVSNAQPSNFYGKIHGEYLVTLHQPSYVVLTKKCNLVHAELIGDGPWDVIVTIDHSKFNKTSQIETRLLKYKVYGSFDIALNNTNDYGLYTFQIHDRLDLKGKSNTTMMVPCPTASISAENTCQFQSSVANLDIRGAHPIHYSILLNKDIISGSTPASKSISTYSAQIPLDTKSTSITYIKLQSLVDKYNNTITFHNNGPYKQIEIHSQPQLSFLKESVYLKHKESNFVPVKAIGKSPYYVQYQFNDKLYSLEQIDPLFQIPINKAGTIELISIKDNNCSGKVKGQSTIQITEVFPPQLKYTRESLKDACFGEFAVKLNLTLQGTPPFYIDYEEFHDNHIVKQRVEVLKFRKLLTLEPQQSGKYTYTITRIGDSVYTEGISLKESFDQIVHPKSQAHFVQTKATMCTNSKLSIPIQFQGKGPWSLVMDQSIDGQRQPTILNNIKDATYPFELTFKQPGTVSYDLVKVIDTNQCTTLLDTEPLMLTIVNTHPWVEFDTNKQGSTHLLKMAKGSTLSVPLLYSSTSLAPFEVVVKHNDVASTFKFKDTSEPLVIKEDGEYTLMSCKDKYCQGTVPSLHSITVEYYPMPTIEIGDYKRTKCQFGMEQVELRLSKSGILFFTLTTYKNNVLIDTKEMRTKDDLFLLELPSQVDGDYRLEITRIGDAYYNTVLKKPLAVPYKVIKTPQFQFKPMNKKCLGDALVIDSAVTEPLQVQLKIRHDTVDIQTTDHTIKVNTAKNIINLTELLESIHPGVYTVTATQATNPIGCMATLNEQLQVHVGSSPSIHLTGQQNKCEGDSVGLKVNGQGPFEIRTKFYPLLLKNNKIELSIDSVENKFDLQDDDELTMITDEPVDSFNIGKVSSNTGMSSKWVLCPI